MNHEEFFFKTSFTECYMSERFIRLNRNYYFPLFIFIVELYVDLKMINSTIVLVHSGRAISFLDLSDQTK